MMSDIELALKQLLKNIFQEVAEDILNDRQFSACRHSPHETDADDSFLLNPKEAARRLSISERHLWTLTHSGNLPCVRIGNCVRYSVETIRKWIRENELLLPPPAKSSRKRIGRTSNTDSKPKPKPKSQIDRTTNAGEEAGRFRRKQVKADV